MNTIYAIPTDPDYYGPECEDGKAMAEILLCHLSEYVKAQGYNVEFRMVPETLSFGNRSRGDEEILDELDRYQERHWIDWA